ncbi:FUN14 domain-containing protein 2-like isoform X1 [Plodia interpunctella]|uniref:FUN14 domain-containing protein 2-like isoform X1 n=1 Tax=Plodia interpunctella TaxID=58824 RepID=UPI002367AA51|nr:FUN14 domain-containing protein 2-like isoform X1 [Plodia interpunctella]
MARSRDRSLGDLRRGDEERSVHRKNLFDKSVDCLSNGTTRHLGIGTLTGWFTGVTVVKVGRIAAFGLGGGILLLHFATELGYLTVNWDRVRETSSNCQALVEKIVTFARNHSGYTVGFIGGFFFGVAST